MKSLNIKSKISCNQDTSIQHSDMTKNWINWPKMLSFRNPQEIELPNFAIIFVFLFLNYIVMNLLSKNSWKYFWLFIVVIIILRIRFIQSWGKFDVMCVISFLSFNWIGIFPITYIIIITIIVILFFATRGQKLHFQNRIFHKNHIFKIALYFVFYFTSILFLLHILC